MPVTPVTAPASPVCTPALPAVTRAQHGTTLLHERNAQCDTQRGRQHSLHTRAGNQDALGTASVTQDAIGLLGGRPDHGVQYGVPPNGNPDGATRKWGQGVPSRDGLGVKGKLLLEQIEERQAYPIQLPLPGRALCVRQRRRDTRGRGRGE